MQNRLIGILSSLLSACHTEYRAKQKGAPDYRYDQLRRPQDDAFETEIA